LALQSAPVTYIAHTRRPLKRAERAGTHRASIMSGHDARQQAFLDFVLAQYVAQGEAELGSVAEIRNTFRGFQRQLHDAGEGSEGRV
jgi:type I restriction enzyme R subunit